MNEMFVMVLPNGVRVDAAAFDPLVSGLCLACNAPAPADHCVCDKCDASFSGYMDAADFVSMVCVDLTPWTDRPEQYAQAEAYHKARMPRDLCEVCHTHPADPGLAQASDIPICSSCFEAAEEEQRFWDDERESLAFEARMQGIGDDDPRWREDLEETPSPEN